ncbi:MAG TPA: phosphopantetheine-binding protein, partial [Thermoanaerobaculia bacterium]
LPSPSSPPRRPPVAPRDPLERDLAGLWRGVLGREAIGVHDDFFALGGDSILSIQIVARLRRRGLDLDPLDVFRHPTIGELAAVLRATPAGGDEEAPAAGFPRLDLDDEQWAGIARHFGQEEA